MTTRKNTLLQDDTAGGATIPSLPHREVPRPTNGEKITQKGLLLEEKLARNATDEV